MNKLISCFLILIFLSGINYAQNNNTIISGYTKNVQYNKQFSKSDSLNNTEKEYVHGDTIRTPMYIYFPGIDEKMKKMTDSIMGEMDTIRTPTLIYFRPKKKELPENNNDNQ